MENKPIILKSTELLIKKSKEIWSFLPEDYQKELHRHIDTINKHFSKIQLKSNYLPESWNKSDELKEAIKNYLTELKNTKNITITEEIIKTVINTIYLKTKDDIKLAIQSYHFSLMRGYAQPYVPDKKAIQLTTIDSLPTKNEVKNAFETIFRNQNITNELINFFGSFNRWAKDKKHSAFTGKKFYLFIKELGKLTEYYPGKVFTTLKFMHVNDTLELPLEYSIVLHWAKKENN